MNSVSGNHAGKRKVAIAPTKRELRPEGELGEIVYTSLTKEAAPVIRYRSRDITRLWRDACKCGRGLIKMEKVSGRSDDMMIIRGVNVFPSQIESILLEASGTEPHYQIILDRKGAYTNRQKDQAVMIFRVLQISRHRLSVGLYLPASINPIVCLVTPAFSASCACESSFSILASFILLTATYYLHKMQNDGVKSTFDLY